MARHNQRSEISATNTTPKHHRVQRMLPTRAHCMGEVLQHCVNDDDLDVRLIFINYLRTKYKFTQSTSDFLTAGNGVLPWLCFRFVRRWVENLGRNYIPVFAIFIPITFFLDLHHLLYIFFSSQETSAGSWNSCNYTWCSSRFGLSSLPNYDSPVSVSSFFRSMLCTDCFSPHALSSTSCYNHFLSCVWQRYQGRKHLADRARAGKTSRFWLCFHRLSCELLRWDSILVKFKTSYYNNLSIYVCIYRVSFLTDGQSVYKNIVTY